MLQVERGHSLIPSYGEMSRWAAIQCMSFTKGVSLAMQTLLILLPLSKFLFHSEVRERLMKGCVLSFLCFSSTFVMCDSFFQVTVPDFNLLTKSLLPRISRRSESILKYKWNKVAKDGLSGCKKRWKRITVKRGF